MSIRSNKDNAFGCGGDDGGGGGDGGNAHGDDDGDGDGSGSWGGIDILLLPEIMTSVFEETTTTTRKPIITTTKNTADETLKTCGLPVSGYTYRMGKVQTSTCVSTNCVEECFEEGGYKCGELCVYFGEELSPVCPYQHAGADPSSR